MQRDLLGFHSLARQAKSLDELNAQFRRAVRSYGFTAHAAATLAPYDPQNVFLLLDWPRAWLEVYAMRGFAQDDIVVREALASPTPFTWTEIRARHPGASARIFAAVAEFGWREGFAIPVHGPGSRRGLVSLAGPGPDIDDTARANVESISLAAYARACEFAGSLESVGEALTPREAEVLALVAKGKSDPEIAGALGISRSTAHFHVESARGKLGAATRAQAVALALTRGQILV